MDTSAHPSSFSFYDCVLGEASLFSHKKSSYDILEQGTPRHTKNMNIFVVLIVLFLIGFFYTGQYLRENFLSNSAAMYARSQPKEVCDGGDCQIDKSEDQQAIITPPEMPYETNPIQSVDDYEYSLVFGNEGNREASRKQISDAMFRYPLDWSVQPPSSAVFQQGMEAFENQQRQDADPNKPPMDLRQFDSISGKNMMPPDMDAIDAEERKELAMYSPERLEEDKEGCKKESQFERVQNLVKKIYDKRGEVAVIKPSRQGKDVWEITEVFKKNEPIVWEDDVPEPSRAELRGEQTIQVPKTVNDLAAGLDPFFEPRPTTRMNKNDYTKWTPGLERMFAPTYPQQQWY